MKESLSTKIVQGSLMFVVVICLNLLSMDIYRICKLGWMDMQLKFQGIRQVKNMLTTVQPSDFLDR